MNSSTDAFKWNLCLQAPMIAPLSSPDVAEACLDVSTVLMVDKSSHWVRPLASSGLA